MIGHAVVHEAKDAGVWVFGGGIDESVPPVLVDGDGFVTEGTYPQTKQIEGGYTVLEVPSHEAALEWAAKIAVACRCAQEVRAFQYDPGQSGDKCVGDRPESVGHRPIDLRHPQDRDIWLRRCRAPA